MAQADLSASPLAGTLARAGDGDEWLTATLGPRPPDAVTVAMLAVEPERLLDMVDRQCHQWGTADRSVGASFVFGLLVWRVVAPVAACYLAESRLPALDPTSVAIAPGEEGLPGPATFTSPRFATLSDDAFATHPDAAVTADRAALRSALRQIITSTVACLIPAMKPWARRGERTQWGEVADRVAGAMSLAGDRLGCQDRARSEAELLLDGTPPLIGGCNWRDLPELPIPQEPRGAVARLDEGNAIDGTT